MEKTCTKCGQTKPLSEFVKASRRPGGVSSHCKACHNALYYEKRAVAQLLHPGDSKKCTKCRETKPVEEFDKRAIARTGYCSHCQDCRRKMSRDWKRRHKTQIQEYQVKWYSEHPDYNRGYSKQHRAEHIEQYRANDRKWYVNHREQVLAYRKRYYAENKAVLIQKSLDYYHTPRGRAVSTNVRHRRRAAKKNSDITPEWLEQLYNIQSHCAYCGQEFGDELSPTLDHITPLSKNGTHTKDNVILACRSCNASKNNNIISASCIDLKCVLQLREFLGGLLTHPIQELL